MIQRIQSIYMLLAVILCGLTYFFPLSLVVGEAGNALTLTACTVSGEVAGESVSGTPFGIAVLLLATIVIVLTAIFKYKRRKVLIFVPVGNGNSLLSLMSVIVDEGASFSQRMLAETKRLNRLWNEAVTGGKRVASCERKNRRFCL